MGTGGPPLRPPRLGSRRKRVGAPQRASAAPGERPL